MAGGPPGWAWQDEDQLHVTLRFIGEVERPLAEDIAAALGSIRASSIGLGLHGVGFFDQGPHGALFARAVPRDPLEALPRRSTGARLGRAGAGTARLPAPHHPRPAAQGGDRSDVLA